METVDLKVNHRPVRLKVDRERSLLWILRTELGLTGTKYGCGQGYCGACTVLVNGEATRSCEVTVASVRGKEIVTIEGLAQGEKLHPVQQAFVDHDALQCGFCTPGMVLTAVSLLKRNPHPSKADIEKGLEDNLCRCAAHHRIVDAVHDASLVMRKGGPK